MYQNLATSLAHCGIHAVKQGFIRRTQFIIWRSGAETFQIFYLLAQVASKINRDTGAAGARERSDDLTSGARITWIPPWPLALCM